MKIKRETLLKYISCISAIALTIAITNSGINTKTQNNIRITQAF